ncbi:MAG: hypothetical protein R3E66_14715 [bacterium]
MTAISLRQRISDTFGVTDLSNGFIGTLLNPFWVGRYDSFPFRTLDNRLSMLSIFEAWEWPTSFTTVKIHPSDDENQRSDEGQSIAACDHSWIFGSMDDGESGAGNEKIVWRVDLTGSLDVDYPETEGVNKAQTPGVFLENSTHFGGGDYYDGKFWLAVQRKNSYSGGVLRYDINPPEAMTRVAFRDSVRFPGIVPNGASFQPPWVSALRGTSLLFSSDFNDTPTPLSLLGFSYQGAAWTNDLLAFLDELPLFTSLVGGTPFQRTRIQGGDLSPTGKVYLVVDEPDSNGGGIYGFDIITGCQMVYIPYSQFSVALPPPLEMVRIPPQSTGGGGIGPIEYQDIEVFDVGTVPHSPNVAGVIHLLVQDNDTVTDDNQSIVHMNVDVPSKA